MKPTSFFHPWRGFLCHGILLLTQPTYILLRHSVNPEYITQTSPTWHAITLITWLFILTRLSIPFFRSPLRRIPCMPNERFPLGNLDFNGGKLPLAKMTTMYNTFPNDGLVAGWIPFYILAEVYPTRPDTVMDIINTHAYDWEKPRAAKKFLTRITGDGLLIVEGDTHKAMRRAVAPAFSGKVVRNLTGLFYSKGQALGQKLADEKSGVVEMMAQMSRVTLDVIGAAGVGKDFNTVENDEDPLARLYAIIADTNKGHLLLAFMVSILIPRWIVKRLGDTVHARIARAQEQLRIDVRALMQEKKQLMKEDKEQQDIISVIMRSGDFSDDYLVDQLLTFLAAGHDTTASALTWTIYLLCQHPEIQSRLRDELTTHIPRSSTSVSASTFDPGTTPYLHAITNEVLRFYSTVPFTTRESIRPTRVGSYEIPPHTNALLSPWAMSRNHALWGPDAEEFRPERWLEGPHADIGGATHPQAFIGFLHGPRSCIGQSFARLEMKCILAALVGRFRFELAEEGEVEIGGFVTVKPVGGLKVRFHDLWAGDEDKGEVNGKDHDLGAESEKA